MTSSSKESFELIEQTTNILLRDDSDYTFIDNNGNYTSTLSTSEEKGKSSNAFDEIEVAPLDFKGDFISILEAQQKKQISPCSYNTNDALQLENEPESDEAKSTICCKLCCGKT